MSPKQIPQRALVPNLEAFLQDLYVGQGGTAAAVTATVSVTSAGMASAINTETNNRISANDILSQQISVLSQAVSVVSQKISVLSQQVSVLSQALSALSVIAGPLVFNSSVRISAGLSVGGSLSLANAFSVASPTATTATVTLLSSYYGTSIQPYLGTPVSWMLVNIGGTNYKIPLYT